MAGWDADEKRWSEWLIQAQDGDEAAYGALLSELSGVIRAYLIARFGPQDILDDCVQESLLGIHQARHTYDASRPIRPWLFAIVRHRTIDQLRKVSRTQRPVQTGDTAYQDTDVDDALDGARLLDSLSSNVREALLLTKFMGLSTRECALQLGVSESVVKVRVHRGMRKMRSKWNSEAA